MGTRGPLPKPSEDRVRRNKTGTDGLEDQTYVLDDVVKIPAGVRFGEPVIQAMWDALKKSVNRQFFEPTDWAYAVLTLTLWDNVLKKGEVPGAMLLSALDSMNARLLMTEADRRRLRIEAKREVKKPEDKPKGSDFYRQAFEEQARKRGLYAVGNEEPE